MQPPERTQTPVTQIVAALFQRDAKPRDRSAKVMCACDPITRWAADRSWMSVKGLAQATVYSPAATAEVTPVTLSSKATDRKGSAPSAAQASVYGAGSGLALDAVSTEIMTGR